MKPGTSNQVMKHGTAELVKKKNKQKIKKDETRNWLDLPQDVMLHIFLKLGVIDLLFSAQSVCASWRKLAREPQLFRCIDFSNPWECFKPHNTLGATLMAMEAIDRSSGQLVDVSIKYICNNNVLRLIGDTCHSLKRLHLATCSHISVLVLIEALKKLPLLEELELCLCPSHVKVIEVAGRSCLQLKSFRLNRKAVVYPPSSVMQEFNSEAFAIAANMPQLRRLHLFGNLMNDDGLKVILEKCPHLEYLDLRQCFHINVNEELQNKLEGIKEIRLPNDSTDGYEFDSSVDFIGFEYDNDDDYDYHYAYEYDDYNDDFAFLDEHDGGEVIF